MDKKEIKINKRAQITIWVIVSIFIASAILLLFIGINKKTTFFPEAESNPQTSIESCIKKAVNEATDILIPNGGFLKPTNVKVYKDINVTYLCENVGYFHVCINQHPLLLNEIKDEITEYVSSKIESCFNSLQNEIKKSGNDIEVSETKFDVSLAPDRIFVNIDKTIEIKKDSSSKKIEGFNIEVANPTYDLARVAIEIASQESKYCYFEYVGYMILYPRFNIKKFAFSDSTKIYTIKDKHSNKEMNIAVRGCAIPGGI